MNEPMHERAKAWRRTHRKQAENTSLRAELDLLLTRVEAALIKATNHSGRKQRRDIAEAKQYATDARALIARGDHGDAAT